MRKRLLFAAFIMLAGLACGCFHHEGTVYELPSEEMSYDELIKDLTGDSHKLGYGRTFWVSDAKGNDVNEQHAWPLKIGLEMEQVLSGAELYGVMPDNPKAKLQKFYAELVDTEKAAEIPNIAIFTEPLEQLPDDERYLYGIKLYYIEESQLFYLYAVYCNNEDSFAYTQVYALTDREAVNRLVDWAKGVLGGG